MFLFFYDSNRVIFMSEVFSSDDNIEIINDLMTRFNTVYFSSIQNSYLGFNTNTAARKGTWYNDVSYFYTIIDAYNTLGSTPRAGYILDSGFKNKIENSKYPFLVLRDDANTTKNLTFYTLGTNTTTNIVDIEIYIPELESYLNANNVNAQNWKKIYMSSAILYKFFKKLYDDYGNNLKDACDQLETISGNIKSFGNGSDVAATATDWITALNLFLNAGLSSGATFTEIGTKLYQILTQPGFQLFTFNKLMYLYYRFAGIVFAYDAYIHLYILRKPSESTKTDDTMGGFCADGVSDTSSYYSTYLGIKKFINFLYTTLNNDVLLTQYSIPAIEKGIYTRQKRDVTYTSVLNDIGANFKEMQNNITLKQSEVRSSLSYDNRGKTYEYVALTIFLVVIGCVVAVMITPLDNSTKIQLAATAIVLATINAMIIYFTYGNFVIETFKSDTIEPFIVTISNQYVTINNTSKNYFMLHGGSCGNGTGDMDINWGTQKDTLLETLRRYLQTLSNISFSVSAYTTYGNKTESLVKEINFHIQNNTTMKNSIAKLDTVTGIKDLEQKSAAARMNFYISSSIIGGATLLCYVIFSGVGWLQTFVLYLGGILIMISVIIMVLELSSPVRTDGDKLYWMAPNTPIKK